MLWAALCIAMYICVCCATEVANLNPEVVGFDQVSECHRAEHRPRRTDHHASPEVIDHLKKDAQDQIYTTAQAVRHTRNTE